MTLFFSYIVRIDDGAAPNPFKGMCSLTICKPRIRSSAKPGDWIAGVGSKNAPSGDLTGRLIYAMHIQQVLTLQEYDERASTEWPDRVPKMDSADIADRLGDCIYDFSGSEPTQRLGVHGPKNVKTDLSGKNALLSKDFYYFGNRAIRLPDELREICPVTQGHRSHINAPFVYAFESWLRGLKFPPGQLYGWPDFVIDWKTNASCDGCLIRTDDDDDENIC